MKLNKNVLAGVLILVVVVVALVSSGAITGLFVTPTPPENYYDDFAKCLTQKGVVMYGSYLCGHCKTQKTMFGDSFQFINYVECHPNGPNPDPQLCTEKGIRGVPAWEINGNLYPGLRSLEELSSLSGCPLE